MKEPVITLTLEEYEELRKERERLEKEHASLQEYSRQVEEISACTAVIADLRWKLADLTRRLWGKSSEKRHLPEDAGQLSICFESPSDVNDPVAEEQKTAEKSVKSENGYNRFRKSFTKKITPHARNGTSSQQCVGKCTVTHCYRQILRPPTSAQTTGRL